MTARRRPWWRCVVRRVDARAQRAALVPTPPRWSIGWRPTCPGARPPGGGVRSCRRRRSDRSSPRSPGRWASEAARRLRRDRVAGRSPRAGALAARRHAFRVRQLAWAVAGLVGAGVLAAAAAPVGQWRWSSSSADRSWRSWWSSSSSPRRPARWQRRIFLELPVVSEQLGMLLGAGYSLGAALSPGGWGTGACGATWCG